MKRVSRAFLAAVILASMIFAGFGASPAEAATRCRTFSETGKTVCGRFLQYWEQNGGLAQQGLPLTDEFIETNPTDGKQYLTQYFERARFEYHPENQPPYDVLLGLLGREQYQAKYPNGHPVIGADPFNDPRLPQECETFPATGKRVCGPFLVYWRQNGALAQQGLPLTDLFLEENPTDGKLYPTQYFERARFEYHIENYGTPYLVLLGLLGREQIQAKYPNGLPVWGPTLTPLAGGKTYTHTNNLFMVNVPTPWGVLASDATSAALVAPDLSAGCAVTVLDTPEAGGLVALDMFVSQQNQSLPGYSQVSKTQVVVYGKPAYRRVITFTAEGVPLQGVQVYFTAGPLAGIILCSTVPPAFAAQTATFDGVAGSLKLAGMP